MDCKICPKCGAKIIEGQLYWATGQKGKMEDLAGLVCDNFSDDQCINEFKGTDHGGQTWEKRRQFIDQAMVEFDKQMLEKNFEI